MTKDIDQLIATQLQINNEFNKACEYLPGLLRGEQESTAHMFFMYMGTTSSILDSIFMSVKHENYYAICILYRSVLEHYLRFQFFYISLANHKRDPEFAWRFIASLDFKEKLELAKTHNAIQKIKKMEEKTSDQIWIQVKESREEFADFTKNEIDLFSKSLSIKNIISYLIKTINLNDPSNELLCDEIILYSQLSSFVHGGLLAHKDAIDMAELEDRNGRYFNIAQRALEITSLIKLLSYAAFYQNEPEFETFLRDTEEHLNKIRSVKNSLEIRVDPHTITTD